MSWSARRSSSSSRSRPSSRPDLPLISRPERRRRSGLYHLAWQVDTVDELAEAHQALLDARSYTGESSHGATKSVYGADPDGNEFEVMWMLPREEWGVYENSAPIHALDLTGEIGRWSGVRTSGRIVRDPVTSGS